MFSHWPQSTPVTTSANAAFESAVKSRRHVICRMLCLKLGRRRSNLSLSLLRSVPGFMFRCNTARGLGIVSRMLVTLDFRCRLTGVSTGLCYCCATGDICCRLLSADAAGSRPLWIAAWCSTGGLCSAATISIVDLSRLNTWTRLIFKVTDRKNRQATSGISMALALGFQKPRFSGFLKNIENLKSPI